MRDQPGGAGETANRRTARWEEWCGLLYTVLGHRSYISSTTVVSLTNKFRNPTSSARIGLVVDMRNLMVSIEQSRVELADQSTTRPWAVSRVHFTWLSTPGQAVKPIMEDPGFTGVYHG